MSENAQSFIVVFLDRVSKEQVKKHADDIVANGGKIKDRYYESPDGINGFSASIPAEYLESFKSFQADQIDYIEPDQSVTIQAA